MALKEEFADQGTWLFRWRSYLPLPLFPFAVVGLIVDDGIGARFGERAEYAFIALCMVVSFSGFLIRCLTIGYVPKGTSRRSTDEQIADTLNTTGMYSIVRHPLYLGNFLMFLGVFFFIQTWWFVLSATLVFFIYYERIMYAEEIFLERKHGNAFIQWAKQTPAIVPRFRRWVPASLPFSLKNVLQREYAGFFGLVAAFTFFAAVQGLFRSGSFVPGPFWVVFFSIGVLLYLVLRVLRKKTNLLHVEGR